ncbi:MAG: phospholipase D-like domain-containing protein [Methanoregula sp.]|nr:MAG: phospholipase D-like domain-containing protein [Methanoregula sp.]
MRSLPVTFVFLFLALIAAGCLGLHGNTAPAIPGQASVTESASPAIHTLIVEPDDGKAMVLSTIAGAHDNLTLTIYEIIDPDIAAALAAAQGRGVVVRVLYNNASFTSMYRTNPDSGVIVNLSRAGVAMKPASPAFTVTHQKTLTADGSRSVIMTFNLQPDYFTTTRDFGIVTTSLPEVREIADVFDADWNYLPVTPAGPTLVWSPVNSRAKILRVIGHATKTLDVYNEEITDKECIDALAAAAKRGVAVRVIAADLRSNGKNDNVPALATLNAGSARAKTITSLYIHAKMVLADYGTPEQVAYLGSENFSKVSLDQNRELGILVTEKPILDRLESVFSQDWLVPAMPET